MMEVHFMCQWVCDSSIIIVGSGNFIEHNNAISLGYETIYIRKVNVMF